MASPTEYISILAIPVGFITVMAVVVLVFAWRRRHLERRERALVSFLTAAFRELPFPAWLRNRDGTIVAVSRELLRTVGSSTTNAIQIRDRIQQLSTRLNWDSPALESTGPLVSRLEIALGPDVTLNHEWTRISLADTRHRGELVYARRISEPASREENRLSDADLDPVCQCGSRSWLNRLTDERISGKHPSTPFVLCLVHINEYTGWFQQTSTSGVERLLSHTVSRIQSKLPDNAHLARLDGPDLVIVFDTTDRSRIHALLETVFLSMEKPVEFEAETHLVSLSVGVAHFPQHGRTLYQLLDACRAVGSQIRGRSGNCYEEYSPHSHPQPAGAHIRAEQLTEAVDSGEIEVQFQPVIQAGTGQPFCIDLQMHWTRPSGDVLTHSTLMHFIQNLGTDNGIVRRLMSDVLDSGRMLGLKRVGFELPAPLVFDDAMVRTLKDEMPAGETLIYFDAAPVAKSRAYRDNLKTLACAGYALYADITETSLAILSMRQTLGLKGLRVSASAFVSKEKGTPHPGLAALVVANLFGLDLIVTGIDTPALRESCLVLNVPRVRGMAYSPPLPFLEARKWSIKIPAEPD